jgi:tight adherence protein B
MIYADPEDASASATSEESSGTDSIVPQSSSGDIIIKEVDNAGFPNISIYLNFKEGSQLGLTALNNNNFEIVENDIPVTDFVVEKVGETTEPIGTVLVLDTSGSMKGEPIEDAIDASTVFIDEMRDIDKIAIVGFSDNVAVHSNFTSDKQALKNSVNILDAGGETALFDGIITGVNQFQNLEDIRHKYLVVLSDGTDTVSNSAIGEVISAAAAQDITVYSVALMSDEFNPSDLEQIALSNNGELLQTTDSEELTGLYSNISSKMRNQYKLSYTSSAPDANNYNTRISVANMGMEDSVMVDYENPFFTFSGSDLTQNAQSSRTFAKSIVVDKWWIKLIIFLFIFISVTVLIYVISTVFIPNKQDLKSRTDYYLYSLTDRDLKIQTSEKKKKKPGLFGRVSKAVSKATDKAGFSVLFEQKLRRAGINMQGSKFVFLHVVAVVAATFATFLITKNYLLTIGIVAIVIFLPFLVMNFKVNQKVKKFNEQLPDTLQLIEGALKAGYSLNQSLAMVIKETKPPISEEFRLTINEIRMGLSEKVALENMAKRINSELFDWVVLAINIQREVGGNLAEIMDIIANTIREKERVLRQIKALTAEGKLSAYILIGLPIILGVALTFLNRDYISVLFTTKLGFMMLGLAGVLMLVGIVWIMRIIKIDY